MIYGDVDLPHYDESERVLVIRETDDYIVGVTRELFNERIIIGRPDEWGQFYVAGFCVVPGLGAAMATMWDMSTMQYPDGIHRIAYDGRDKSHPEEYSPEQYLCKWCPTQGENRYATKHGQLQTAVEGEHLCSQCGSRRDNCSLYTFKDPTVLRFPRRLA